MPTFSELMSKLADGKKLDPFEREQLRLIKRQMDENYVNVGLWTNHDRSVNTDYLNLPYFQVYSERLVEALASITIRVPSGGRNLIIKGSGSIDTANGGNIWAQVNGDTGASNYAWQLVTGDGSTVSATEDTTFHGLALGVFGTTGAGAGVNGSFRAELIGYGSTVWKKNCISTIYTAEFNAQHFVGSTWTNTDPIHTIEIFGTNNTLAKGTANLAAGCEFVVYLEK
jgi:hypothetical protein